ncbi:MAG: CNNM domain-containing protein, partial [Chlamydiia bacterium]
MEGNVWFWLLITLGCVACQGLFAMAEMACISFPRVRLYYEAAQGYVSAQRLLDLLREPARLFGTTLLLVNLGLQCGAEAARQLYIAIGLNPDWSPLTQVPLVVLAGELAPLFAARRAPEPVARFMTPVLYMAAILLRPITALLGFITSTVTRWVGAHQPDSALSLSREELQRAFEETSDGEDIALNQFIDRLFALRNQSAADLMQPMQHSLIVPAHLPIDQVRLLMREAPVEEILLYQKQPYQITGVVLTRELFPYAGAQRVQVAARAPWFVAAQTPALHVLRQFRQGRGTLAVVLNEEGTAMGIIALEDLLPVLFPTLPSESPTTVVERTFPGEFQVRLFNQLYQANLPHPEHTLEQL